MNQTPIENSETKSLPVKKIAFIAIFIALSAIGAMIKIPSPVGSIAFDSAPGYFCALAFGYLEGIVVIAAGHILTSGTAGFPLGLPLHLCIALQMVLWATAIRWITVHFGLMAGSVITVLLNGVVSSFTMFFIGGIGAVWGIMPFLLGGSLANILLAAIAYKAVSKSKLI